MSFSFADLKKNSKSMDALREEVAKIDNKKKFEKEVDERFWQPTSDDAGNSFAKIRFLPAPGDESSPFIKMIEFSFQGPASETQKGLWYYENSLTAIGQKDPAQEYNNYLWAKGESTGNKSYQKQMKSQKRNIYYLSNILVIQDKNKPENEGKVFLFRYGQKLFEKLKSKLVPPENIKPEDIDPEEYFNIFDFWEGADFSVKISKNTFKTDDGKTVEFRDWDKSEFRSPSKLLDGDDEKLEKIWRQEYSLKEFLDHKNFKTYDELLERLEKVMRVEPGCLFGAPEVKAKKSAKEVEEELDDSLDHLMKKSEEKKEVKKDFTPKKEEKVDEDDDDFFNSLMNDDD